MSAAVAGAEEATSDPTGLTLAEASAAIRSLALTPTRLVQTCLGRIETYNPKLNAFITVLRDQALANAAELEREQRAGRLRSPLHGIPIALKDNIDTAGIRNTAGARYLTIAFPSRMPR